MVDSASAVVLEYCAAVRGILNDDQGGPLHPPGLRMAEALQEVRESIQRNLDAKKGGFAEKQLDRLAGCIDRGLEHVQAEQEPIREYVKDIDEVAATLEPGSESREHRQAKFEELIDRFEQNEDPIRQHMARLMISFLAGLFVGEGKFEEIKDNLDLERWFRLPKSHERRIHGHRHAGVRNRPRGTNIADFRGRLTCLLHTQFSPQTGRFFPVFSAFEGRDMSAL